MLSNNTAWYPNTRPSPNHGSARSIEGGSLISPWRNTNEIDPSKRPRSLGRPPRVAACGSWHGNTSIPSVTSRRGPLVRVTWPISREQGRRALCFAPVDLEHLGAVQFLSWIRDSYRFSSRTMSHWLARRRSQYTSRLFASVCASGAWCGAISCV